ncbi:MAG: hypothetical protein AB8E15_03050 [Bdellovibrionales bacterium]
MPFKKLLTTMVCVGVNTIIIYFTPRVLLSIFDSDSPWISFCFQYSMGALFFANGLLLALTSRACVLSRSRDRFWLIVLVLGFLGYFFVHMSWIYIAQNFLVRESI